MYLLFYKACLLCIIFILDYDILYDIILCYIFRIFRIPIILVIFVICILLFDIMCVWIYKSFTSYAN